jgi:hypothetical protein
MASNQSTRMKNMQKLQRLQSRQYRRSMQRLQRLQSRQRMQNRRRMQRLQNRQSRQSRQRINNETPASLTQLRSFLYKINIEITRLSASGTSDPLIVSRINTLTNIKNDVIDVIKKIKTGVYTPDTVPIMESDINKSLPILGNQNAPLPRILKRLNLPREASSLFPNGMSPKDSEQAAQINNIMKGYMKNLFEGASWNFNIQYEPPNKRSSCDTSPEGLPGLKNKLCNSLLYSSEDPINTKGSPYKNNSSEGPTKLKGLPGVDDSSGNSSRDNIVQQGRPGSLTNRIFPDTRAGNFSWEERSKEIVKQIRKRGLNPLQYGAIPDNTIVSDEFSWRGYTRMMCMRLNATTDPGLAITVGCPPEEWNGWKE